MEFAASWNPLISSKIRATTTTSKMKSMAESGVFQDDMKDDVADVAATIEHFLQQFVEVLENDHAQGAMVPVVKIAQHLEHQFVGFTFDFLKGVVLRFHSLQMNALSQLLNQRHNSLASLLEHLELLAQGQTADVLGRKEKAFAELLDGLWNFVKRVRQGLDVLALERRHKGAGKMFGELLGDALIFAAGLRESIQRALFLGGFKHFGKALDAGPCFLGAFFHQPKEFVILAQ